MSPDPTIPGCPRCSHPEPGHFEHCKESRVKALESIAEQAARYIETITRPNETTETISSAHLWARGVEIAGEIRAILKPEGKQQ